MAKEVHLKSVSATTVPLHFHGPSSSAFSVSLQAPTLLESTAYTLPKKDGTSKQVLSTNGSEILDWEDGINIGTSNLTVIGTGTPRTLTLSSGNGSNFKILDSNTNPFINFQKGRTDVYSTLRILPKSGSSFGGVLQIYEGDTYGSGYVGLKVGASHSASISYTLPTGPPASNKVLQSTSAGVMSWVAAGGADTNIANTNLTTDNVGRTLTLINSGSWGIYDNNASMVASFSSGTILLQSTVQIISDTASANALEFRGNTSSGATYVIGLQAPDSVTADAPYILPQLPATSGQVLSSTSAGVMSWQDSAPMLVMGGGGYLPITTLNDNGDRAVLLGGVFGFCDYDWSIDMGTSVPSITGLGNPGTDTSPGNALRVYTGIFKTPTSGTPVVSGVINPAHASEVAGKVAYIYVYKLPTGAVSNMLTGADQSAEIQYELVASSKITFGSSFGGSNITYPISFESTNGYDVNKDDFLFATMTYEGIVTATRTFGVNFSLNIV